MGSDDGYDYDYPRHSVPVDRDDDSERGYARDDLTRERSRRDHRSRLYDDEDTNFGRYERPTHRGLPNRRDTGPYAPDAAIDEHEYEPRDRYRGSAGRVRGTGTRRGSISPRTLDDSDSDDDSEVEHGGRGVRRGQGWRRGAGSRYAGRRLDGEDESEFEPRATRGGYGGRGVESRRRPDLRFNGDGCEDEQVGPRQGYIRDARGGIHPRRRGGLNTLSEDDLDDSEDEGMRSGRRGAVSLGRSSRRE